jgi:hypothetical protein
MSEMPYSLDVQLGEAKVIENGGKECKILQRLQS